MRKKNSGVTLMELLTVMVIVGILAAIAIPSYRSYNIRANRADAKTALLATAGALERCFTRFNSYDPDDGCAVVLPTTSSEGLYTISGAPTATTFVLTATPVAGKGQDDDAKCANFTLDNANTKGVTGTLPARECWSR
jgi:type IV pilus assembly protein PilE